MLWDAQSAKEATESYFPLPDVPHDSDQDIFVQHDERTRTSYINANKGAETRVFANDMEGKIEGMHEYLKGEADIPDRCVW